MMRPSRDPDGMYEMDEMEELLKEEGDEFDKESESDNSEDVVFQQTSHYLSFKQKRYLQSLPPGSLVGQIAHRLEKEGTPLPFYLFWPWPKIRATFKALIWLGWLAVVVAAFWPIIEMYLFPRNCYKGVQSNVHLLQGPLLNVDLPLNSSLTFLKENSKVMEDVNVKNIHLSSPSLLMNIHRVAGLSTAEFEDAELAVLKEICSFCDRHEMKVIVSINVTVIVQQLSTVLKDHNLGEQQDLEMRHKNGTASANSGQDTNPLYAFLLYLVDLGVDGFYIDTSGYTNSKELDEYLESFRKLKNKTEKDILFGTDSSLISNSSIISITGVELDASCFSNASELHEWIENYFHTKPEITILWKVPHESISESGSINLNLNFLGAVLPGIPLLESAYLEQLREDNNSMSLLWELLMIRKKAITLHENNYSRLRDKGHLKKNVYAILRSYQEEKQYLVLWNLSNSSVVSLDFHSLSIQGRWIFRSLESFDSSSSFKMRNVPNLLPYELAVIELP